MILQRAALMALLLTGCASVPSPTPTPTTSPLWGYWLTEDDESIVELAACKSDGRATCGQLVRFSAPPDTRDYLNSNWLEWGRRLCSAEIVRGLLPDVANKTWHGGRLYDPDVGDTYHLRAELSQDVLRLHVFYGADSAELANMAIGAAISGPSAWAAASFLTRALIGEKSLAEDIIWTRIDAPVTQCKETTSDEVASRQILNQN